MKSEMRKWRFLNCGISLTAPKEVSLRVRACSDELGGPNMDSCGAGMSPGVTSH